MDPIERFQAEVDQNIEVLAKDPSLRQKSIDWMLAMAIGNYTYNFSWLGRPVIQYPQDIVAMQALIWRTRPDLIVETGIAHGGSLVLSASMLALLDYTDAVAAGVALSPRESQRRVLGVDIDIRPHNRAAIQAHPLAHLIEMVQGSSIAAETVEQVRRRATQFKRVLVVLDSNHTHEHVLAELRAFAPLVTAGSYCVVFDTVIEDTPPEYIPDRPWGKGNNPKTAVWAYLEELGRDGVLATDGSPLRFEIDKRIESQIQITVAPDGYLRRA